MSAENTEQYRAFIAKLQREDQRPDALNEIKNLFVLKPPVDVTSTLKVVGIAEIVNCLNVTEKSHIDLACDVLKVCFDKFSAGEVIKSYTGHIMYLLRHEKTCVRRLAIDEVYKAITCDPCVLPVPEYIDVFVATGQMVCDTDVGVANRAMLITSNLPAPAYPKVLDEMKIALESNCSSKCNAFEVVVNISTKSLELFNLCTEMNYINVMVDELEMSTDVLYQLNILELLSRLVITSHGVNYLAHNGILNNIAENLKGLKQNPLGGLLTPGYMKFFGCIAHHYPKEVFDKYPALLDLLFETIDSGNQSLLPVALDTLGFIGITIEGKLCLASLGSNYTQIVEKVCLLIKNSATDFKVRAIHCFANLIGIDKDPYKPKTGPVDHRVTLMTREWFRSLNTKPTAMETLLDMCKNPFPDIRLEAFSLLDAVTQHQWGEELVARTAGFIEYLLDRTVDHTKESKEVKYDIIKRLANSPAFDSNIISRLQTYVEQGPFYTETTMEVAMEDGE